MVPFTAHLKYLDGHAIALGGSITDGGNFNWNNGKYPQLSTPDQTYHGLVYTESFGPAAYIVKARVQLMRDLGATPAPQNSFLLMWVWKPLRFVCNVIMKMHSRSRVLEKHPQVAKSELPRLIELTRLRANKNTTERFVWCYFL